MAKSLDNSDPRVQAASDTQNKTASDYLSMPREERKAAVAAAVEKAEGKK